MNSISQGLPSLKEERGITKNTAIGVIVVVIVIAAVYALLTGGGGRRVEC